MGVGVFLRSFYQLKLKLFFSSIGTFSCCFPFCSEQTKEGWNFVCSNYHMTWSAFALFLARRTEFAFNIGHFLMIFPFRFLTTFQVSVSLIFDIFWSHCSGWNSSVRVKIKEYVHALSEFLFVSLLVIFDFFFQINHFCYFTFLHGLQDVENHCAHLRDIELWRLVKKSPLSPCIILYIIGLKSMELQNQKNIYLLRIQRKGHKNKSQKDMNEMERHKMDYRIWYFQQCACVDAICFAPVVTTA